MDREKITKYLNAPPLSKTTDEGAFLPGICHVQLGNFSEAKRLFESAIVAMLQASRPFWKASHPDWLVDVCVLADRDDLYADVRQALDRFGLEKSTRSLLFLYSNSVMELLLPSGEGITRQVQGLLKYPKIKMWHAVGLALQAIDNRDSLTLNGMLEKVLQAHEGQVKHGGLRETAEGLLCMPAMSLAYTALKQDLRIELDNDYLPLGYLNHLRK